MNVIINPFIRLLLEPCEVAPDGSVPTIHVIFFPLLLPSLMAAAQEFLLARKEM